MSKWCMDCKHCVDDYWCMRPIEGTSPVTGKQQELTRYCYQERVDPTGCGPDGKFFEERSPNGR